MSTRSDREDNGSTDKISAGYAHESGPMHELKKKLKTQVVTMKSCNRG